MNQQSAKLLFFALDQVAKWTEVMIKARKNPTMTAEESKAAVAATQAEAADIGEQWDQFRNQD